MPDHPQIVFQDDSVLVLDKPSGWVVNRATSVKTPTIQDWVENGNYIPILNSTACSSSEAVSQDATSAFINRSGVVHRLDKETSGLLIIAKTPLAFTRLQSQFEKRKVQKIYLALVHGRLEPKEGTIRAPVGRQTFNRRKFGIVPDGRPSITRYEVVEYYSCRNVKEQWQSPFTKFLISSGGNRAHPPQSLPCFTLLRLHPQTGRTHQLRVHLKYVNHPIVCDPLYLGNKTLKKDRHWCPRLFLHAHRIQFTHPYSNILMPFSSPLPPDLQNTLSVS